MGENDRLYGAAEFARRSTSSQPDGAARATSPPAVARVLAYRLHADLWQVLIAEPRSSGNEPARRRSGGKATIRREELGRLAVLVSACEPARKPRTVGVTDGAGLEPVTIPIPVCF